MVLRVFVHEGYTRLLDNRLPKVSVLLLLVTGGKVTIGVLQQVWSIARLLSHKCEPRAGYEAIVLHSIRHWLSTHPLGLGRINRVEAHHE